MKFRVFSDKNPDGYGDYKYSETFTDDMIKTYNTGVVENKLSKAAVFYGHGGFGIVGDRSGRENQQVDGWVTKLEKDDKGYVVADISNVSDRLKSDLRNKRVAHSSIEMRVNRKREGDTRYFTDPTLTGVAMLGVDEPHVKGTGLLKLEAKLTANKGSDVETLSVPMVVDKNTFNFSKNEDDLLSVSKLFSKEELADLEKRRKAMLEKSSEDEKTQNTDKQLTLKLGSGDVKPKDKGETLTDEEKLSRLELIDLKRQVAEMKLQKKTDEFLKEGKITPAQVQLFVALALTMSNEQQRLFFQFVLTTPTKFTLGAPYFVNEAKADADMSRDAAVAKLQAERKISYAEAYDAYMNEQGGQA